MAMKHLQYLILLLLFERKVEVYPSQYVANESYKPYSAEINL